MKTLNRFSLLLLTTVLLGIMSCHKDDNPANNVAFNNTQKVTASIYGTVTDESGNAVSGANVTLGGTSAVTNADGLFFFSNVSTSQRAATVVVSKTGYFNGSRTLFVQANGKHTVRIMLMAKGVAQTFSAQSGGAVSFDGVSISFPANGIVNKATGAVYSGTVNVYAHKIDPTTDAGKLSMPGDLRGLATAGNENALTSYGMFVAELYDASGNALQIADGSEATITMDIPASLQGSAPSTIPLWYYDEQKGVWIQDGNAVMQNGKYVGTVKHFSFWNCDTPAAAIDLQMTLVDQAGNALQEYTVVLTNNSNNDERSGWTNSNGWVGGLVYPNATLTMTVYPPYNSSCSTVPVYSQTVTTGSSNQNLGTITVTIQPANATIINATIQDCNNNPLSNAAVVIQPMGTIISPDASGNISYTLPCTPSSAITLVAYDLTNNVNGSSSATTLTLGVNNLGTINACGTQTPFLNFTLTNTVTSASQSVSFISPADYLSLYGNGGSTTGIYGSGGSNTGTNGSSISFIANRISVGVADVTGDSASLYVSPSSLPDQQFTLNTSNAGTTTFTSYPASGFVEGTFSINYTGNTTGNAYTATGSFRINH